MYETIVVGFHKSDTAREAVRHAAGLAQTVGAHLHLVSSYAGKGGADSAAHDAEAALESYQLGSARSVETHALPGDPADAILRVAAEVKADLIVVGNKGLQGSRKLAGSIAGAVTQKAPCAVLVAHTT